MKGIVILFTGVIIGLLLGMYFIIMGDATNFQIGKDRAEIIHYVKIKNQWIQR